MSGTHTPALQAMVQDARDVAVTLWKESSEPVRPRMTGASARANSRPPEAREAKTIMMPQSKKMPERNGPSRAKSVVPPLRRELSSREMGDLAARTAELKLEAAKRTKEVYAKVREKEKTEKKKSDKEKAEK